MDGWQMDMDGVVVNVLKIGYYYYNTIAIYFSCAKNAKPQPNIRIARSLVYLFH